jgi:hypothetical protein
MKALFLLFALFGSVAAFAQSAPFAITAVQRNADNTVTLKWNSEPGKWYQLEYSPDLVTWQTLNELVVSQGTTSMSADVGRYDLTPKLKRPFQSGETRRFWRAREIGVNQGTAPTVTITSPSNNDTVSGVISVPVTTSGTSEVGTISLYVDGELFAEQSGPSTTFTLNTSEWANGAHQIYAMGGDSQGGTDTTPSSSTQPTTNYGVSTTLALTFDNFVSAFFFSEHYFRPDLGETQTISAKFKESANWTLTVTNSTDTTVFTTTGSGSSVSYTWDGKDGSGTLVPADAYAYRIVTDHISPASLMARSAASNSSTSSTGDESSVNFRPVTNNAGTSGITFGVAYQGHHPAPSGWLPPRANSFNYVQFVPVDYQVPFDVLNSVSGIATGFASTFQKFGRATPGSQFGTSGVLGNDDLTGAKLRAPTNVFNTVNLGLLIGHGVQGNRPDLIGGSGKIETYYPIYTTGATEYDWVRIHECQFGGSLRWMGILACNMLGTTAVPNWEPSAAWPFDPDKLHLLLSASTSVYMYKSFGTNWAWAMTGKLKNFPTPQPVRRSWLLAGYVTQSIAAADIVQKGGSPVQVDFRVIGSSNCLEERITQNIGPNGDVVVRTTTVYDPTNPSLPVPN